jgi:hypothetical protein
MVTRLPPLTCSASHHIHTKHHTPHVTHHRPNSAQDFSRKILDVSPVLSCPFVTFRCSFVIVFSNQLRATLRQCNVCSITNAMLSSSFHESQERALLKTKNPFSSGGRYEVTLSRITNQH